MPYDKDVRELVKLRLMGTPSNITMSIDGSGEFTRDQLIEEADEGSAAGDAAIRIELLFIRKMACM